MRGSASVSTRLAWSVYGMDNHGWRSISFDGRCPLLKVRRCTLVFKIRMYLQCIPIPRHVTLRTDDSIQILVNLTWIINGTISTNFRSFFWSNQSVIVPRFHHQFAITRWFFLAIVLLPISIWPNPRVANLHRTPTECLQTLFFCYKTQCAFWLALK